MDGLPEDLREREQVIDLFLSLRSSMTYWDRKIFNPDTLNGRNERHTWAHVLRFTRSKGGGREGRGSFFDDVELFRWSLLGSLTSQFYSGWAVEKEVLNQPRDEEATSLNY